MYTRLSQETGMDLDYELPVNAGQAIDWRAAIGAWQRLLPKRVDSEEGVCAR